MPRLTLCRVALAVLISASVVAPLFSQDLPEPIRETDTNPNAPTPTKIGFVDIELIIENSLAIRKALEAIDDHMARMAVDIDTKDREFRRMRFELDRQERVLSKSERDKRVAELGQSQDDINRLKFEFEQELAERERQIEPVLERIMQIVADVAERDGFQMVLRGEVVIYGHQTADLTNVVIDQLDSDVDAIVKLFNAESSDDETTMTEKTLVPRDANPSDLLPMIP